MGTILVIPNADFSKNFVSQTDAIKFKTLLSRESLSDDFDISCDTQDQFYAACDKNVPKNVQIKKIRIYISSKVLTSITYAVVKGVLNSNIEDAQIYNISDSDIERGYKDIILNTPIILTDSNSFIGVRPISMSGTTYVYRAKSTLEGDEDASFIFVRQNGNLGHSSTYFVPKITYFGEMIVE